MSGSMLPNVDCKSQVPETTAMESCLGVEVDLDKAISKFNGLSQHADRILDEAVQQLINLKSEIAEIGPDTPLTPLQLQVVKETTHRIRDTILHLATDHRDLHASVSRVGKAVDRHFICDYTAVAPKAEIFCTDDNRPIMEQAIAQHVYRMGLDEVGDTFLEEAQVKGIERKSPFAVVERIAKSLCEGDTGPALRWVHHRQDQLMDSALPFTLHTMHALKMANQGAMAAAIAYARQKFPQHASRHEKQLQAAVCAMAWCTPPLPGAKAPTAPSQYKLLLSPKAMGASVSELFIQEACTLLRVPPLSPLAGAVRAGCRVLPALHDIRAKVTQPHVIAAWAEDELPLEVDLGEDGGSNHSVFSCPILRQQTSVQNPPMRLLCGHAISRDALNKLTTGVKLKCPYCPMEQSPTETRQIYFF